MGWGEMIALVVALISVAGAIWIQLIQFKKDSNKIGDVKADTAELKPKTEQICRRVEKIEDRVVEHITPTLSCLERTAESSSAGISELLEELHFQKRLKENITLSEEKEYFVGGVEKLFEENCKLQMRVRELTAKNQQLVFEKEKLERQLEYVSSKKPKAPFMEPDIPL